jgi:hypothetical protein
LCDGAESVHVSGIGGQSSEGREHVCLDVDFDIPPSPQFRPDTLIDVTHLQQHRQHEYQHGHRYSTDLTATTAPSPGIPFGPTGG